MKQLLEWFSAAFTHIEKYCELADEKKSERFGAPKIIRLKTILSLSLNTSVTLKHEC